MAEGIILPNGEAKAEQLAKGKKPAIVLDFDPQTQQIRVLVDSDQVKTWDFARGLLLMGVQAAERQADAAMMRAAHEAAQANAIRGQVMGDLRKR